MQAIGHPLEFRAAGIQGIAPAGAGELHHAAGTDHDRLEGIAKEVAHGPVADLHQIALENEHGALHIGQARRPFVKHLVVGQCAGHQLSRHQANDGKHGQRHQNLH